MWVLIIPNNEHYAKEIVLIYNKNWQNVKCTLQCKSEMIKAPAKCINVNIINENCQHMNQMHLDTHEFLFHYIHNMCLKTNQIEQCNHFWISLFSFACTRAGWCVLHQHNLHSYSLLLLKFKLFSFFLKSLDTVTLGPNEDGKHPKIFYFL